MVGAKWRSSYFDVSGGTAGVLVINELRLNLVILTVEWEQGSVFKGLLTLPCYMCKKTRSSMTLFDIWGQCCRSLLSFSHIACMGRGTRLD